MELYFRFDRNVVIESVFRESRRAEAIGFDGISSVDFDHDPFFPLVLAAQATSKIKLETRIAVAFPRSPTAMAYMGWDLQRLSRGRFKLGLGTQGKRQNEERFAVKWTDPMPRFREYVRAVREVWKSWKTGQQPDFRGEHYRVTLMPPEFTPEPMKYPTPPIYLAAVNPRACRLAGEIADGVMFQTLCTVDYVKEVTLPAVAEGAKAAGRLPRDIKFSAAGYVVAGGNKKELEEATGYVRRYVAFMSCYSPLYIKVYELHGWAEEHARMRQLADTGRVSEVPGLITDEMLETFAVVGYYDEVGGRLMERWKGVAQELGLFLFLPSLSYGQKGAALRRILRPIR